MEKEVIIVVAGIAAVLLYLHYHNAPAVAVVAHANTPATQTSTVVTGAVAGGAVDIIDSISASISDALN